VAEKMSAYFTAPAKGKNFYQKSEKKAWGKIQTEKNHPIQQSFFI